MSKLIIEMAQNLMKAYVAELLPRSKYSALHRTVIMWTARMRNSFNSKTLRKRLIKKTPSQKSKELKRSAYSYGSENIGDFDIDVEDLLQNPFNTQPPSLTDLSRATGFSRQWLMFVYRNFKQHCPNGRMTVSQWKEIFQLIMPTCADYSFADRMFKSMDPCQAGCVTFEDMVLCVFDLSNEMNVDGGMAADFAFSLMDPDCRGRLDKQQFIAYTQTVFDLNGLAKDCGSFVERQFSRQEVVRRAVQRFEVLDEDQDGYVTILDIERIFKQSHIVNSSWFTCKREDGWTQQQSRSSSLPLVSSVGRGRNRAATLVKAEKRRAIYSTSLTLQKPSPVHV